MVPELNGGEVFHVRCPTEANVFRWQAVRSGYIAETSHHRVKKWLKVSELINVLLLLHRK